MTKISEALNEDARRRYPGFMGALVEGQKNATLLRVEKRLNSLEMKHHDFQNFFYSVVLPRLDLEVQKSSARQNTGTQINTPQTKETNPQSSTPSTDPTSSSTEPISWRAVIWFIAGIIQPHGKVLVHYIGLGVLLSIILSTLNLLGVI